MLEKVEKSELFSNEDASSNSKPWQSYHTTYTNAKAVLGMDGMDKEKVQRIVYEMSKGSKYFENEERKEALMRQKTENMHERCGKLSTADISHYQKVAERRITKLEAGHDLSRVWLHVDMDAFYAAVETLSNPSLKGKPMAVGGMSMISTANYEKQGQMRVHSGGILWKKQGGGKVVEVDKSNISALYWMKVQRSDELGVQSNDGIYYKFTGFWDPAGDEQLVDHYLTEFKQVFGDRELLQAAIDAARVLWSRGLLKRVGICHGISGNAYVFLALYRATGNAEYLYKAKAFACFLQDKARRLIAEGFMHIWR